MVVGGQVALAAGGPSIEQLKEAAEKEPKAARQLGLRLIRGDGIGRDIQEGIRYLEKAADGGDIQSARFLYRSFSDPKSSFYAPDKAKRLKEIFSEKSGPKNTQAEAPSYSRQEKWPLQDLPKNSPSSGGSGFAINSQGVFITNFHVVNGCRRVVAVYNGMRGYAKLVGVSEVDDLAAIKVEGQTAVFLPIRKGAVALGESVAVAGYPVGIMDDGSDGASMKLSQGIVARIFDDSLLQMSASVSSGNSGGPVVDKGGFLVGVSVGKVPAGKVKRGKAFGDDYNFAVRGDKVRELLSNLREDHFVRTKTAKSLETELVAQVLQQATAHILCYR